MKKESLVEVDPSEDTRCPEGTKKYLLNQGYRPYRKESGRIVWRNASDRVYKSIKRPRRRSILYGRVGGRYALRMWVKVMIGLFFLAVVSYSIYIILF